MIKVVLFFHLVYSFHSGRCATSSARVGRVPKPCNLSEKVFWRYELVVREGRGQIPKHHQLGMVYCMQLGIYQCHHVVRIKLGRMRTPMGSRRLGDGIDQLFD